MLSDPVTFANGYQAIRVPSKVLSYWTEPNRGAPVLFCGLEDGRVYQSKIVDEARQWVLHTPSMEGR